VLGKKEEQRRKNVEGRREKKKINIKKKQLAQQVYKLKG